MDRVKKAANEKAAKQALDRLCKTFSAFHIHVKTPFLTQDVSQMPRIRILSPNQHRICQRLKPTYTNTASRLASVGSLSSQALVTCQSGHAFYIVSFQYDLSFSTIIIQFLGDDVRLAEGEGSKKCRAEEAAAKNAALRWGS